jgi:rifampicin phosphotransferase
MQLLPAIGPRVVSGRAIDILDVAPDRGLSRGFARVDLGDPVFFDHPLDHVPGMLLAVMGRDLEQRGIVDESADVFLLRLDELFAVYEGSMSRAAAREVIARRAVLHEGYRKLKAPARFATMGVGYSPEELTRAGWRLSDDATQAPAGTVLNGTPSSPGVVTGRAVVVEKPEDFSSGILVAYRTDPGWVAALPFASALLIERASPLTHVAVIARELGVPTVVQIDGLTSAIRTGMTVSVDGASGRITLLEDQPDEARSDA